MTAIEEKVFEKGMPWSHFAETLALGAVRQSGGRLLPDLRAKIRVDDLAIQKHRKIFEAMIELHELGKPIDDATLLDQIERRGTAALVGGLTGILSLSEQTPRLDSLDAYADIIVELAKRRAIIEASNTIVGEAIGRSVDSQELITKLIGELRSIGERGLTRGPASSRQILEADRKAVLEPHRQECGVRTGYRRLDQLLGEFRPGQLIVLAGRPGMGKTGFALRIAYLIAAELMNLGSAALFFSLEMQRSALLRRLLCGLARVDIAKHRAGVVTAEERARISSAVAEVDKLPLLIDDTAGADLAHIEAHARRAKEQQGLSAIFVDYMQLLSSRSRAENRVQEVSQLSRGLKRLAMDLEVPVVALSQLSRAPEHRADPRPVLADLRESGSIEQDADVVLFVFREEVYKPDREDLKGLADLIVAKHRDGPTARLPLVFLPRFARFEERAMQSDGSGHAE